MNGIYEAVAESIPQPDLLFFNYGLWRPGQDDSWIAPADLRYRHHLNLVRHVLGDVDLKGKSVLEVGCGRGGNCYYLELYSGAARIVGVDVCLPNLELARRNPRLQRTEFVAGDAQWLPFACESIDVVLNLESAHCYGDFDSFVGEAARVLKGGGIFCFADVWNIDVLNLDWGARERALRQAPLEMIAEEDISQQVFQAMSLAGNISEQLEALAAPGNQKLVDRINGGGKALRAGLALGEYSYLLYRMKKRQVLA
jgi:ubiquinone/menaquinone biosynthesis C-methylase UbiE